MGQQNSSQLDSRPVQPAPPQPQPKSPPPAPPPVPKTPTYAIPENRVLPLGATELPNKRRLLRPVSQELSKFHPEFAHIFPPQDREQVDPGLGRDNKENVTSASPALTSSVSSGVGPERGGFNLSRLSNPPATKEIERKLHNTHELLRSQSLQEKRSNGHVIMNGDVSMDPTGSDVTERGRAGAAVTRTNSLDRSTSSPSKGRGHKRYPSASTAQPSVIPEDPREHLYTHWRQDPFTNPTPSTTSLPLQNSFPLDYKLNLTYAQLAEHRRQRRGADLQDRTGQKLAHLNADLQEQSTVKVSPFDRKNYTPTPSQPCGSSTTGSSDTGVSKSKKRRAPPPPSSGGGPPPRDSSPGRFSLDVEPPADYDLDDPSPPLEVPSPWKSQLCRHDSNVSMMSKTSSSSKGPAPTAPPAPSPAPVPPPPPQNSASKASDVSPSKGTQPAATPGLFSSQSTRLIAQAKAEIEALKKLEMILKEKDSANAQNKTAENTDNDDGMNEDKNEQESEDVPTKDSDLSDKNAPEQSTGGEQSPSTAPEDNKDRDKKETSSSNNITPRPESTHSPRRLSSLLQHDIILAAQARSAKGQVKAKTPVQHVKPKDPAELFREEIAKAATAREERLRSVEQEKEKKDQDLTDTANTSDQSLVFQSDMVKVKRKPAASEVWNSEKNGIESQSSPPPVISKPEPPVTEMHVERKTSMTKSESDLLQASRDEEAISRQRPPEGYPDEKSHVRKVVSRDGIMDLSDDDDFSVPPQTTSSTRQYTQDWKPEDDLDTDDEMMEDLTYSRSSTVLQASDGFKSSMIPGKVDDLKAAKRKTSKTDRRESGSFTDEKNKFGSIRKFQKSVNKSVRNAFGSISKASGKLLRRNKSHDLGQEDVEGVKYRVSTEDDTPPRAILTNGTVHNFHMNGDISDEESADDDDDDEEGDDPSTRATGDKPVRVMKRAGVAYVSQKGQIVVLPEYERVHLDEDGNVLDIKEDDNRAPKISRKKKKYTYESTVRRQERDRLERHYAGEIREKERQIQVERRRQQDMEREFHRLRDMETQEKLQRLQTAQLQQQVNLLQQQQQQQQLSSLQFPAASSYHVPPHQRYSVPELPSQPGGVYSTVTGLGGVAPIPSVNMSSYSLHSTPFVTPPSTTPTTTVAGYDVNYLSNYMRMMGIQPPSTQQQWAYLLSNIQGVSPNNLLTPASKSTGLLVGSAGPDLSHLFPSKAAPSCTDSSALLAQKASLMNILNVGHLSQTLPPNTNSATTGGLTLNGPNTMGVVNQLLPEEKATPRQSMGKKASTEDPDCTLTERANPVYVSSGEDEEEETWRSSRKTSRKSGTGKGRPHSAFLPLSHSSVYRDVTSREEADVMRVQVPDYRDQHRDQHTDQHTDQHRDRSDQSDSSGEEEDTSEKVERAEKGVGMKKVKAAREADGERGVLQTGQVQHKVPPSELTAALPAKVYAPLGYRPVSFTAPQPRPTVQADKAVDR